MKKCPLILLHAGLILLFAASLTPLAHGGSGSQPGQISAQGQSTQTAPPVTTARHETHADNPVLAERHETAAEHDARMAWFRDARFGMFIHWGLYAQAGGEWKGKFVPPINGCQEWIMFTAHIPIADYATLAKDFNPRNYDAEKWVLAARDAGMNYIVITAKHHEGFAMFKTAASPYNIVDATPFGRDPLRELAAACRKHNMKLGFYYSQNLDWHHPGGGSGEWDPAHQGDADAYVDRIVIPQLREILTSYGKIDVLWFDIPGGVINKARAERVQAAVLECQPGILINNRLGGGYHGDTETPEQHIPANGFPGRDWETCMTMNGTWGFSKFDHDWKSSTEIVRMLCDIASKGGNYLLNVGPNPLGEMPQPSLERLAQVGAWMKRNGVAIYGTRATPFKTVMPWGRVTQSGNQLHLIVFDLPQDRRLRLRGLTTPVLGAHLLADANKTALPVSSDNGGPVITVPITPPAELDPVAFVIEANLSGPPAVEVVIQSGADGTLTLTAPDAEFKRPPSGSAGLTETATVQLEGDHIGFWTHAEESVGWDCAVLKEDQYRVSFELACPASEAGSQVSVLVNEVEAGVFTVPATGSDWKSFQWIPAFEIKLPQGRTTLGLKPLSKHANAIMNLRQLKLERPIHHAVTNTVAEGLIQRLLPRQADQFVVETMPAENGRDVFEIENRAGKIVLRGNHGVAQAAAFNWYLKHVAGGEVSLAGDQLTLPDPLPQPAQKIHQATPYAVRGQMNYCTFCYTAAFWGWPEWEREIDRMAMNGVNTPLMIVGNEKVWQNTLRRLGYRDGDILKFIPGSAFTAWWLMGNLEGEGGPLSQAMIDRETELAQKILARMRAYGMDPIQQGFCGLVPTTFASYFPTARVIPQGTWAGGYVRPSVLSPLDPMFPKVAAFWYEEQAKLYGKIKYFGGDLFHEGGRSAGLNLADCAKAIQSEQQKHAPGAVWVLQGWGGNPNPQLLAATDPEQVLVQQLAAYPDRISLAGFQERPWVFASANNFGGHESFGGPLNCLATLPTEALQKPNHHLVGLALLDEALDTHPALWDMFSDTVWAAKDIDLNTWCRAFPSYRYGHTNADTSAAWEIIGTKVMTYRPRENLLCARPGLDIHSTCTWGDCDTKQNPTDMIDAAELLLQAAVPLHTAPTYRHDCVDAVRQVMVDYGYYLYHAMIADYQAGQPAACRANLQLFRELLRDMDQLLASDPSSLLGTWISLARKKGATPAESAQYERMARQLVTLWTPGHSDLNDYAYKNWSGLYRDYYLPRWENFLTQLDRSLDHPELKPRFVGQAAEIAWVAATNSYSAVPVGDAIALAKSCLAKYGERSRLLVTTYESETNRWLWSLDGVSEQHQILTLDVTDRVVAGGPGDYRVRIEWLTGANAIIIHGVALDKTVAMAVDGERIAEDAHAGRSGMVTRDNVYTLTVGKVVSGAKYLLRVRVEGDNGNDSHGRVQMEKAAGSRLSQK